MNYLAFALREKRMLTFGLSFTFIASFGQTFLISLFVPHFLEDFQLSNAAFGTLYSLATLGSAATLPWLGGGIDRLPLKRYSYLVAGGLLAASLLLALSWHVAVFFAALLLLRLTGQGLSGHTAQTAMARQFTVRRGKALSIVGLGYPLGEAFFPMLIAGLLTILGWREIWLIFAGVIAFVFIPFLAVVLKRPAEQRNGQRTGKRPGKRVQ
ncbi:MAG: MFS transporter [Balneolaceae bacterium]|nr:MFS transporter [Balneolaceae bacterium]